MDSDSNGEESNGDALNQINAFNHAMMIRRQELEEEMQEQPDGDVFVQEAELNVRVPRERDDDSIGKSMMKS